MHVGTLRTGGSASVRRAAGTCSESGDRCLDSCVDADGDGVCAPDDCNDDNPRVFPGATERCDAMDVDEDCDPTTYGPVDADGDGFNATRCCNVSASGARTCGDDCDDTRRIVNPDAREVCDADGRDDDCDPATTDAMLQVTCFADADRDRYAAMGTMGTLRCACLDTETSLAPASGSFDCDDGNAGVSPMATETCARGDQNCDGSDDPVGGCSCAAGELIDCGFSPACVARGIATMTYSCSIGGTRDCPPDSVFPVAGNELLCNDLDDDCDGNVDEGFTKVSCVADSDGDGYALQTAQARLVCPDVTRAAVGNCPIGTTNRVPVVGVPGSFDCNDANSAYSPDATDVCATTEDEDCDGVGQEGLIACLPDLDSDKWAAVSATAVMVCPDASLARADVGRCPAGTTDRLPRTGMFSTYDCDDSNLSVFPGAAENCTTDVDEDCSCGGMTAPTSCGRPSGVTCWFDGDRDGFAALGAITRMETCGACQDQYTSVRPESGVLSSYDCDDTTGSRRLATACYLDADGDDRQDSIVLSYQCRNVARADFEFCPVGYTGDTRIDCMPGAATRRDLVTCYADNDSDKATPLPLTPRTVCNDTSRADGNCPVQFTSYTASDCNDSDNDVQATVACYPDADGDGYRANVSATAVCARLCPPGNTPNTGVDCCDRDGNARPGATAYALMPNACGSFDYDCSGAVEQQYPSSSTLRCGNGCTLLGTPGWTTIIPACGTSGSFTLAYVCLAFPSCTRTPMVMARAQSCR